MTDFIKKAVKAIGGGKHAAIMAVLLVIGVLLTAFGEGFPELRGNEEKR